MKAVTALGAHDRILDRLGSEGLLVPGVPQNPRACRPSPPAHAVPRGDLLDAERGDR